MNKIQMKVSNIRKAKLQRLSKDGQTAKTIYQMKQNHIGHSEKNYQFLMELYLKLKDWLYLKLWGRKC